MADAEPNFVATVPENAADVEQLENGISLHEVAAQPLWRNTYYLVGHWNLFAAALLDRSPYWVPWVDWYDRRVRGEDDGLTMESTFTSVPAELWPYGAGVVNSWIAEQIIPNERDTARRSSAESTYAQMQQAIARWHERVRPQSVPGRLHNRPPIEFLDSQDLPEFLDPQNLSDKKPAELGGACTGISTCAIGRDTATGRIAAAEGHKTVATAGNWQTNL
jgi:hypothetical protein